MLAAQLGYVCKEYDYYPSKARVVLYIIIGRFVLFSEARVLAYEWLVFLDGASFCHRV